MPDVLHLSYPVSDTGEPLPPPKPSSGPSCHHTRFVIISDTHNMTPKLPDGDVLLHCGDLTRMGRLKDFEQCIEWLRSLPFSIKIIIAGNHDHGADTKRGWYQQNYQRFHPSPDPTPKDPSKIQDLLKGPISQSANIIYLECETVKIKRKARKYKTTIGEGKEVEIEEPEGNREWEVFGSPWTPEFGGWAWNYKRGEEAERIASLIPPTTSILLTHGPPYLILDRVLRDNQSVGCESLLKRIRDVIRPRIHGFGHIHESRGGVEVTWLKNGGMGLDPDSRVGEDNYQDWMKVNHGPGMDIDDNDDGVETIVGGPSGPGTGEGEEGKDKTWFINASISSLVRWPNLPVVIDLDEDL